MSAVDDMRRRARQRLEKTKNGSAIELWLASSISANTETNCAQSAACGRLVVPTFNVAVT
jgi:hypothetical protein